MENQKIELRRQRNFGEAISTTLGFVRQELKPLFKSTMLICGTAILASSILLGRFMGNIYGPIFNKGLQTNTTSYDVYNSNIAALLTEYSLFIFIGLITMALMNTVTTVYVKLYAMKGKTSPQFEEVWAETKRYFLPVLLHSFIYVLAIIIGLVFFILPGIYLAIVLAPFAQVIIFENKRSVGEVWKKCFYIISDNFWETLLFYFLIYLIVSFAGNGIGIIVGALAGLMSYFTTHNFISTFGLLYGTISLVSYAMYVIVFIAICINYFSLKEKKEGTGLMEKIENMTAGNTAHSNIEERY